MLGAKSLEQRVLGGYIESYEPCTGSPIPAVHRTDALLEQSRHLRSRSVMRSSSPAYRPNDDEWGDPNSWTSAELDDAFAADPNERSGAISSTTC